MKNLLIAVIAAAGFSFATPYANATDDALVNDDVVKLFTEAINSAELAEPPPPQADTQGAMQPQAIPVVVPLLRVVFTVETFRFLLSVWDHVVSNWEFYRGRISGESGSTWVRSCSVDSISETPEVPEVILHCPAHPASLRSESE